MTASPTPASAATPPQRELMRERYGSQRPSLLLTAVVGTVVVLFLGWVVWAAAGQADQPVRWRTTGYSEPSDTSVVVEFDVFKPAEANVSCVVRALDVSKTEVGRATVPVVSDQPDVHIVYDLSVTSRPTAAEVSECQLDPATSQGATQP